MFLHMISQSFWFLKPIVVSLHTESIILHFALKKDNAQNVGFSKFTIKWKFINFYQLTVENVNWNFVQNEQKNSLSKPNVQNKMQWEFWGNCIPFTSFWKNHLTWNAIINSNTLKFVERGNSNHFFCWKHLQVIVAVVLFFHDTFPDENIITTSRITEIALELKPTN